MKRVNILRPFGEWDINLKYSKPNIWRKEMYKKIICALGLAATILSLIGCGGKNEAKTYEVNHKVGEEKSTAEVAKPVEDDGMAEFDELLEGKYAVLIEVENYGDIFVELDADAAPISVTNFMKLVNEDYYSGLTFHRIIEGFMMQGGQSKDKPAKCIKGEFAANGIDNPIKHVRGTISMARANNPDSANSQFFICHQDSDFLDGQYAAFGHVVSGIEVVDKICEDAIVEDDNGTVAPENQPVIKAIYDVTAEYRADALGEAGFIPSNALEEAVGRDTFDSNDEILSLLTPGMAYGYADIMGADEPVLLLATEGVYDNGDGTMVTIQAVPYIKMSDGRVRSGSLLSSGGTAYPISVLDGIVYCGSNHSMEGACIDTSQDSPGIMDIFYLYESFDEAANCTYGGFIRETNNVMEAGRDIAEDDGKPLEDSYKEFEKAKPVAFTVVE